MFTKSASKFFFTSKTAAIAFIGFFISTTAMLLAIGVGASMAFVMIPGMIAALLLFVFLFVDEQVDNQNKTYNVDPVVHYLTAQQRNLSV